jgi:TolA-binding protein
MESYSSLLVTEEANLVVPFLLESIESPEVTLQFYEKTVEHYQTAAQQIDRLLKGLTKGKYDREFVVDMLPKSVAQGRDVRPQKGEINRYVFELMGTGPWQQSSGNYYDLLELKESLEQWLGRLKQVGAYDRGTYKGLIDSVESDLKQAKSLAADYKNLLRAMVKERLQQRKLYYRSYLRQSQFALARNLDKALGVSESVDVNGKTIDEETVRLAYRRYLDSAEENAINRRAALIRLAALEIDRSDQLLATETSEKTAKDKAQQHLTVGIQLLNTIIDDYPQHKDNDVVLYQLVQAYEKKADRQNAVVAMRKLVDYYPDSRFYTQIQFKLGEEYLVGNQSIDAELAYSAALQRGDDGSIYYKRALYNRGWSRLKQSVYEDALEDFFEVLKISDYGDHRKLTSAESELYEDVLRAISLCFSNQGGLDTLKKYFNVHSDSPYKAAVYRKLGGMYQEQGREFDASEIFQAYIDLYPLSAYAPQFSLKLVNIWQGTRHKKRELAARKQFDQLFKLDGRFWKQNDTKQFSNIRQALKNNMLTMSAYYHARYQNSKQTDDLSKAKYWYQRLFKYFPADDETGDSHFLFAELLEEAGDLDSALVQFDKASNFKRNDGKSAEAAYAKIVTIDKLEKKNNTPGKADELLLEKTKHTIAFAEQYPQDHRIHDALLHVLQRLYKRKFYKKAIEVADHILALPKSKHFTAILVIKANSLFELQEYADSEKLYKQVIAKADPDTIRENDVKERYASTIYKQAEFHERNGDQETALRYYLKVAHQAVDTKVAPVADFDAATLLIKQKSWSEAQSLLEKFRRRYPGHSLQPEVTQKLAIIYLENQNGQDAAVEFEKIAEDTNLDIQTRREALWQSAELNESQGNTLKAIQLYEQYVQNFPEPFDEAIEARFHLVELHRKNNMVDGISYWQREIIDADADAGSRRSDRSRYLAAKATLSMANRYIEKFNKIALVGPVKEALRNKKNAMKQALDLLTKVSGYAIQDTTTEATYKIADLYYQFSSGLLNSERPKELTGEALAQYELLLEEQAFPFEEKAIEYHKINTAFAQQGVYDKWVGKSFMHLANLLPAQYNKKERVDPFINIPLIVYKPNDPAGQVYSNM